MTEFLGSVLLLSMLAFMASRTVSPFPVKVSGETLVELPLRPIFRLLDQRINIIAIMAVLLLGSGYLGEQWISHGLFLFTIVVMVAVLIFPARYQFTTDGVSPNRVTFRPWSDFDSWEITGNVIWLKSTVRLGSLKLYIASVDQAAVLKLLRRTLPAGLREESEAVSAAREPGRPLGRKGGKK